MKRLILSIFSLLVLSFASYAQCYSPNWSEPSLDSMLIYVSSASLNGTDLQVDDEIGVFDGDECVGVGVLTQVLTGGTVYLVIEVSRDDILTVDVDGFSPGNTITYRFCSGGEVVNPSVSPTYVTNGPNFAINDSCIVELSAVNTAPSFTSTALTDVQEDALYTYTAVAEDIDGDDLTYTAEVLPLWLSFDVDTQILTGTPGNDEVGDHDVTLRVSDGLLHEDQVFVITVGNENDAPTITSIPDTVAVQDVPYSSSITAEDIDTDDVLTFIDTDIPLWLLFDVDTQVLSGTPGNDEVGYHSVTLSVFDGTVTVDTTFTIRVANANDAPTFTSIPDTVALEDALYSSAVTAEDIDGDDLTFIGTDIPYWLLFDVDTQVLTGTPGNDEVGYHSVTLSVFDGTVTVDSTFTIRVANENDTPTITSIPDTVAYEDLLYSSSITAADIDIGDVLTYSASLPLPTWLLFDEDTQVLSGTPENDDVGYHSVTLNVFDGTVTVDTTFTIRVANENDAPTFTSMPDTVALEDALYTSTVTASDMDGDTLIFSAPLLPDWLLFDVATQVLSGTPGNDEVGFHSVTLSVTDGTVTVDTAFTIRVANENDAPTFTSAPITTGQQGTLYTYTSVAEDIDGDNLIFSAPVLPIWLDFDTETHVLSGTPDNDHTGNQSVSLMINDGTVDVFQSFVIDVVNVNDPPSITSTPVTEARPGVAYEYTVTAVDVDGDALTYEARVLPGWLTFNPSTQLLSATPSDQDIGDQHVSIRVSDGSLYVDHNFVITVSSANHAPTFTSDPATSVVVGDSYVYTVTANDIDGDALTYTAPVLPDWLTFYPETHVISGVPRSGDIGRHDVTLSVTDGTVTADQSFPIFVEDVNSEPTFTSTPITTAMEGELYVYNVFAEDVDGDDLIFNAPVLPGWLSFDIITQVLHGTPDNENVGDHNVTLMVSDGKGTETQSFIITVEFGSGLGLDDDFTSDLMLIYPNPSDGIFSIELSEALESEVILEVLDPLGKVLLQQKFSPYTLIQEEYNLSNRPSGIYFIRVYNASFQNLKKLMLR